MQQQTEQHLSSSYPSLEVQVGVAGRGNFLGDSDSRLLAEKLSQPRNLDQVNEAFDRGDTETRDVARFTTAGRRAVMQYGRTGSVGSADFAILNASIERANGSFQYAMEHPEHAEFQSSAGWNFSVNAQSFRNGNLYWARHIDQCVERVLQDATGQLPGQGIDALLNARRLAGGLQFADQAARAVWQEVSQRYPAEMAWYLAERSQHSENYQRDRFQREIVEAKQHAYSLITSYADEYDLPLVCKQRALEQLYCADFSAFDHLITGIDSGNGVLGDYQSGTLRVETKLGGNPARPANPSDPLGTTSHELFHATSAQHENVNGTWDVGLRSGDQGLDANEGMTELLNKLSLGRIQQVGTRYKFTDYHHGQETAANVYDHQVKSMFVLMKNRPTSFTTLFHAYFGNVPDTNRLQEAFEDFNTTMRRFSA